MLESESDFRPGLGRQMNEQDLQAWEAYLQEHPELTAHGTAAAPSPAVPEVVPPTPAAGAEPVQQKGAADAPTEAHPTG